jgi:hypothetical protein
VACARRAHDPAAAFAGGLRTRRAYSVLDARDVAGRHRLLRIRPHFPRAPRPPAPGDGEAEGEAAAAEWSGAWCEGGPEWADHPEVRAALAAAGAPAGGGDGGDFGMGWGDWAEAFDCAWVCQVTSLWFGAGCAR